MQDDSIGCAARIYSGSTQYSWVRRSISMGNRMGVSNRIWVLLIAIWLTTGLSAQVSSRPRKPDSPAVVQWKARTPAIEKALSRDKFFGVPEWPVAVVDAFGGSDDKLSVVLVVCGHGGAYSDAIVALRLERGQPVLAKLRDAKGKHVENGFLIGASVMHSVDVKLVPEKKAIYDMYSESDSDGRPAAKCGVKAYVWNSKSRTFDLDTRLSRTASEDYCRSLRSEQ
jgi:hypothetical protein